MTSNQASKSDENVPEGWTIWHGRSTGTVQKLDTYEDDSNSSTVEEIPAQMSSAIFIQVDSNRKNPVFVPVTGIVFAVHLLPFHANVFLQDGSILEMPVNLARTIQNGQKIHALGSPIWVEGLPPGKLWVNCKLA